MLREAAEAEWESCPGDTSINTADKGLSEGEEELRNAVAPRASQRISTGQAAQQTRATSADTQLSSKH